VRYVRQIRNASLLVLVVTMLFASPAVLRAGFDCIEVVPYWGFELTDGTVQCNQAESTCDAICQTCFGYGWQCSYINSCDDGEYLAASCM
jgi:hypothetical protein